MAEGLDATCSKFNPRRHGAGEDPVGPAGIRPQNAVWNRWLMSAPLLFTPIRRGPEGKVEIVAVGLVRKLLKDGAGDRARTGDVQLGKLKI